MPDEPNAGGRPLLPRILHCHTCGKTRACSEAELLAYIGDGWPRCCGETMALFVEAIWPGRTTDNK